MKKLMFIVALVAAFASIASSQTFTPQNGMHYEVQTFRRDTCRATDSAAYIYYAPVSGKFIGIWVTSKIADSMVVRFAKYNGDYLGTGDSLLTSMQCIETNNGTFYSLPTATAFAAKVQAGSKYRIEFIMPNTNQTFVGISVMFIVAWNY